MKRQIFLLNHQELLAENIWRMELLGNAEAEPGQFVEISLPQFFLRRPLSVCDCTASHLSIVYKTIGCGTEALSRLKAGTELDILCGLGHGFDLNKAGNNPLLVGGGVGVPPLYFLARRLMERGCRPTAILGFNRASEAFFLKEMSELGVHVFVATMDGSLGVKGVVTDILPEHHDFTYACGPLPMLKALYPHTEKSGAEFSLEERMGCGFGACMGCSIKTKEGSRKVCTNGPVFPREALPW